MVLIAAHVLEVFSHDLASVAEADLFVAQVGAVLVVGGEVHLELAAVQVELVQVTQRRGGQVLVPELTEAVALGLLALLVELQAELGEGSHRPQRLAQLPVARIVWNVPHEDTARVRLRCCGRCETAGLRSGGRRLDPVGGR